MTHFAPIGPPKILAQLKEAAVLGSYHLLLAHDVVEQAEAYHEIFDTLNDAYIIMDNSVCELGEPVSTEIMCKACNIVTPSTIVLPDYIGDAKKTVEASMHYARKWATAGLDEFGFMVAPQGQTMNEMRHCTSKLLEIPGVMSWGVPKASVDVLGSRQGLISYLYSRASHFDMHLLGFSNNLLDDIACARRPEISGIDSAVPIRLGLSEIEMSLDNPAKQPPRGNYWDETAFAGCALTNLKKIREWICDYS